MVVTPLLDNDTTERNPTALQLLVNAPVNYKTSDSDVNVFLDKYNFERDLPNGSYQIQHYEVCNDKVLNDWAEDLIGTLNIAHFSSIITLNLSDLVDKLASSKNNKFTFRSFSLLDTYKFKNKATKIFNLSNILIYIGSQKDISIAEYREILDNISSEFNKSSIMGVSFFKWPGLKNIEVSLLYDLMNQNQSISKEDRV